LRVDNLARVITQTEQELRQLELARGRGLAVTAAVPAVVWLSIGSAHFRLGHRAEAEGGFESAIALDPKLGEAHNNLAVLYMMDGRFGDAETEIVAAEEAGFAVSPKFKEDLAARKAKAR
jgi:Flp pilus assembly protein TadD